MDQRISTDVVNHRNGDYAPIGDQEDPKLGMFDKRLPCFGCGIGWFSLLLGFVFPVMWYYAAFLYFAKHYQKDPRERIGLEASAVAALICTVAVLITIAVFVIKALFH
ncbi:60S ribosomal protein L18a-like protein [Pyrus x bretschneideri]|uniref:60S ribosomal protein L18a-like protein n=1 Tax=Pyrus x bretschneideri TaxID=225117 RepID=UPI00203015B3|nr:60S ribosomal protein L18a-like protein [Pyrus x bretschneideri]XP_048443219.1 60S ribosomal protein L18a-like protein [Pyrus x bretschneideri]XP_048443220.1 60S ribosomal protein L18a-like protein [Pyrus x bretschneideri]